MGVISPRTATSAPPSSSQSHDRIAVAPPEPADRKLTVPEMAAVRRRQAPPPPPAREPALSVSELLEDAEDRPTDICSRRSLSGDAHLGARDCATLVRLDGSSAGQPFAIPRGQRQRFGRGRDAEVRVDDDGVSRTHAALHPDDGGWVIVDLSSSNGTMVQGERISRRKLADGDVIHLGPRVSFRFTLVDAAQQTMMMRLFESSTRDALCGCASRKHFEERLLAEVAHAARHGAELSLMMLDIDHFKSINDTHGHPGGDAVLRLVSGTLQSRLRTEDLLGRWGGEEFAVLLRSSSLSGAARAAERLRVAVSGARAMHEGALVPVTVSIGCASLACAPHGGADDLVAIADRRLYDAKRSGRNRVVASG